MHSPFINPCGTSDESRKRCRNPRCGGNLPEPVENPHRAFCTRGCWQQFHRHRCFVCERTIERKVEHQRLCGRRKCQAEARRWPAVYLPFQAAKAPGTTNSSSKYGSPLTNVDSTGIKTRIRSLRGWRWIKVDESWHLHNREGCLVTRIAQEGVGWWVCQPRAIPELPIEPFEAAQRRAEAMALSALSLDPTTATRIRAANRNPMAAES
jgi:hypothetical protein